MNTFVPLALLALLSASCFVDASHFRYGTIFWTSESVGTSAQVTFNLELAWRRSYFSPLPVVGTVLKASDSGSTFPFGDGATSTTFTMTVVTVAQADDWIICSSVINHTYSSGNNNGKPWQATFTGSARIASLLNNAEQNWNLITSVDTTLAKSSPMSKALPVATVLGVNSLAVATVDLAAVDDLGQQLHYSLATPDQMCGSGSKCVQPTGMTIDSVSGQVSWTLAGVKPGLWCSQVLVTTTAGLTVPVDFILNYTQVAGVCGSGCSNAGKQCYTGADCGSCTGGCVQPQPPAFQWPSPSPNATITGVVGKPVTFQLVAQSPQPWTVTVQAGSLPAGATLTAVNVSNPSVYRFTWTAGAADIGQTIVCFSASDNTMKLTTAPYCLTIAISSAVCTPACKHGNCVSGACTCDVGYTGADCSVFGGELGSGSTYYGSLYMQDSDFFYFNITKARPNIKLVLTTLSSISQTALFVSTIYKQPTVVWSEWNAIGGTPNTITILPSDWNYKVGTYYVAVFGWYANVGTSIDYTITLYTSN